MYYVLTAGYPGSPSVEDIIVKVYYVLTAGYPGSTSVVDIIVKVTMSLLLVSLVLPQ